MRSPQCVVRWSSTNSPSRCCAQTLTRRNWTKLPRTHSRTPTWTTWPGRRSQGTFSRPGRYLGFRPVRSEGSASTHSTQITCGSWTNVTRRSGPVATWSRLTHGWCRRGRFRFRPRDSRIRRRNSDGGPPSPLRRNPNVSGEAVPVARWCVGPAGDPPTLEQWLNRHQSSERAWLPRVALGLGRLGTHPQRPATGIEFSFALLARS
jgi:hypothetical protein